MANIRIKDLPLEGAPKFDDRVPLDLSTTRQATVEAFVLAGRPTASKPEAEAGTDPKKAMTPLTTRQAIEGQIGNSIASAAQGALADSAVQPNDVPDLVPIYEAALV